MTDGSIPLHSDKLVLMMEIGEIYKLDPDKVWVEFFQLTNQILRIRPNAEIFVCMVLPHLRNEREALPYVSTFNANLADVVPGMASFGQNIKLINCHKLFMTDYTILDKVTGYLH